MKARLVLNETEQTAILIRGNGKIHPPKGSAIIEKPRRSDIPDWAIANRLDESGELVQPQIKADDIAAIDSAYHQDLYEKHIEQAGKDAAYTPDEWNYLFGHKVTEPEKGGVKEKLS